ncbi:ABC transporter [Microbacterium sp. BWT-B31]|uniref:ABC transporter n=1 Tax=Microbacterium sp. BWT-B31 TaxID=3232072 RepID=UPI003527606B
MSEPTNTSGDPVAEERHDVDDVVGSVNESLADAEAAGRGAVAAPAPEAPQSTPEAATIEAATIESETAGAEPAAEPARAAEETIAYDAAASHSDAATTAYPVEAETTAYDAPTTAYDEYVPTAVVAPSEPVADAGVAVASVAPIFVQAPEPPTPRGNRAAAGAIGLLAALSFGVLYLGAWLGIGAVNGEVTADNVGTAAVDALQTWSLWVPIVVFYLAFWLLGAMINRGRWGVWVVVGVLVGLAGYGGHLLGQLFQAPFWLLTAREGLALVESQLFAPLAVFAFVFARELTIWFGAWASARGRKVAELNNAAQFEYERTLEAGPTLVRQ